MAESTVLTLQHDTQNVGTYPFTDNSTFTSKSKQVLPLGMFVDATIYTIGGEVKQFISNLTMSSQGLEVSISDSSGVLCTGSISNTSTSSQIVLYDKYNRNVGILLGNSNLGSLFSLPPGSYDFNSNALQFVSTCVAPQPQNTLQGILLSDGSLFTGDVWLVGSNGVVLTWDNVRNLIVVNIVGDPLFQQRNCTSDVSGYNNPIPLQAINIITDTRQQITPIPDSQGNIRITPGSNLAPDNIIRVQDITNGMDISLVGKVD